MRARGTAREHVVHHAVGPRVAIVIRVAEQLAVLAEQAVVAAPGVDADAVEPRGRRARPARARAACRATAAGTSQCSDPCSRTGSLAKRHTSVRSRTPARSRPDIARPLSAPRSKARKCASMRKALEHTSGRPAAPTRFAGVPRVVLRVRNSGQSAACGPRAAGESPRAISRCETAAETCRGAVAGRGSRCDRDIGAAHVRRHDSGRHRRRAGHPASRALLGAALVHASGPPAAAASRRPLRVRRASRRHQRTLVLVDDQRRQRPGHAGRRGPELRPPQRTASAFC